MKENREKLQQTLKADYKDIDKLFKEQLIKTKVGFSVIGTTIADCSGRRICQ